MGQQLTVGGHCEGFACTQRSDNWWAGPVATFIGLNLFGMYATIRAFSGVHYWHAAYLSPFYSPPLFIDVAAAGAAPMQHAWFGAFPAWWPAFIPASPAILILAFPLSFRATCYYYRKAYYRAFFGTPPGCAVGAVPQGRYNGETRLFLFQNLHRFALYFALAFILFLAYDAAISFHHPEHGFGIGVGSIVLTLNVFFLGSYTLGCHSFRHLIGGTLNRFTGGGMAGLRHSLWQKVTKLNERHMNFAWLSLFWVGFSDLYVLLCSMGVITDFNTWP